MNEDLRFSKTLARATIYFGMVMGESGRVGEPRESRGEGGIKLMSGTTISF